MHLKKNRWTNYFLAPVLLFTLSVLFLLVFSKTTSTLYLDYGMDSSIFRVVGKSMLDGKVLYTDVMDNKGPVLYAIQFIGALINRGEFGVFIVQIINLFSILLIVKAITKKMNVSFVVPLVLLLLLLSYFFDGGNLSEEYSITLIFLTLFLWLHKPYTPKTLLTLGIIASLCFFIRANNALTCVLLPFFMLFSIHDQKLEFVKYIKNLTFFGASFLLTSLATLLPFLFLGNLRDFWYGTFGFNTMYSGISLHELLSNLDTHYGRWSVASLILPLIAVICIRYSTHSLNNQIYRLQFCLAITTPIMLLTSRYAYTHYLMLSIPSVLLSTISILHFSSKVLPSKIYIPAHIIIAILGINLIATNSKEALFIESQNNLGQKFIINTAQAYDHIMTVDEGPSSKLSVLTYNVPPGWYLETETNPSFKFFILQDWWTATDPEVSESFANYLQYGENNEWLVLNNRIPPQHTSVKRVISNSYSKEYWNEDFTIMHKNN